MEIETQLRTRRVALGLTQQALAARSGLSLATIQGIERGTANPSARVLEALARPLRLEVRLDPVLPSEADAARLGLPIGAPAPVQASEPELLASLDDLLVARREGRLTDSRFWDAVVATSLALRDHYPAVFSRLREKGALQVPEAPEGRLVKLRRIALANISRYL